MSGAGAEVVFENKTAPSAAHWIFTQSNRALGIAQTAAVLSWVDSVKWIPIAKMKDVAARCGVSESTVSHVLNGTKFVSPPTRKKVPRALQEMNFHRDSHARCRARGHSNFLGLIISDLENPFYPGLIKAFETAALAQGFEVLLGTTNYDPVRTDDAFRKMIENKSPGVAVLTSRVDPKTVRSLVKQLRLPFNAARRQGIITHNPAEAGELPARRPR